MSRSKGLNLRQAGLLALAAFLLVGSMALVQADGGYDLSWSTVDGGGGECSGGGYTLTGTAGQPDAGVLSGEGYTLQGGFQRCAVLHDLNNDGLVDVADIMLVASHWRMTNEDPDWDARYDLDGDGIITVVDIMKVAARWGQRC